VGNYLIGRTASNYAECDLMVIARFLFLMIYLQTITLPRYQEQLQNHTDSEYATISTISADAVITTNYWYVYVYVCDVNK